VSRSRPRPPDRPTVAALGAALGDRRVARALNLALRDVHIRERFAELRGEGLRVEEAVERLRGPHADHNNRPYYLSDERVRSIVYEKSGR